MGMNSLDGRTHHRLDRGTKGPHVRSRLAPLRVAGMAIAVLLAASTAAHAAGTGTDATLGNKQSSAQIKWLLPEPTGAIKVRLWDGSATIDHCSDQGGSQSFAYIASGLGSRAADQLLRVLIAASLAGRPVEIYTLYDGGVCYIKGVTLPEA